MIIATNRHKGQTADETSDENPLMYMNMLDMYAMVQNV